MCKDSLFDDCSFIVKGDFKMTESIVSVKQRARISNKKFYIKPLYINAEEFIFLDFNSLDTSNKCNVKKNLLIF